MTHAEVLQVPATVEGRPRLGPVRTSEPSAAPTHGRASEGAIAEVVELADGAEIVVRPIELADAFALRRMFDRLSPTSVYHRFFAPIPAPRREMLVHMARVDHRHREALVALVDNEVIGLASYDGQPDGDTAEVAITVEDDWQGRGVGTALLHRLARLARRRDLVAFTAVVLGENSDAVRFLRRLSPEGEVALEGGQYVAYLPLARPADGRSLTR